jgi:Na+-transporting NADH:ubiquinone oxidoreductase subunit NqrB
MPKGLVLVLLLAMTELATLNPSESHGEVNVLAAVLTALGLDLLMGLGQKPRRLISVGGLITGLIVADILSATAPWYVAAATTAIAIVSKHLLKIKRKPIFNPAAFGLLAAIFLFPVGQSWWGSLSLLPGWCIVLLVAAGGLVAQKVNKFPQVLAFLGTYFSLLLMMGIFHLGLPSDTPGDALRIPFVNSAVFLAFFMLTDPPTSPAKYKQQVYFGVISAVFSILIFALQGGLAYLFVGLLLANGWRVWAMRKPQFVRVST